MHDYNRDNNEEIDAFSGLYVIPSNINLGHGELID